MYENQKKIWKVWKIWAFLIPECINNTKIECDQRWGANLADFNFDIQYRPGQQNKDAQDKKDVESTAGPEAYSGT